jgi:uncharacterized protein YndB with AHSA1/START domain
VANTDTAPAIIVERITIDAPMSAVFAALTEPEQLTAWWGSDESYRATSMEVDLRAGGAWKTTGIGRDGKPFCVSGTYLIVDPPRCVEFTWRHDFGSHADAATDTLVRYELADRDGLTELCVTHSNFISVADRDNHANGWKQVLLWLKGYLTR